jgi:uncharacterized protein YutE (UPF0331/DUF86 family)
MVDRDKASRLLGELTGCLADLRRYSVRVTREELNTVRDTQHMVLRALYVATQAAVDLAMHLGAARSPTSTSADAALPPTATYQDAFRRLADAGILERDLAERLGAWAGFRNVLAHFYASVDSTAPTTPSASSATSNASPPSWRHESIRGDAWVSLAKNVTATLALAPQPPETVSHLVAWAPAGDGEPRQRFRDQEVLSASRLGTARNRPTSALRPARARSQRALPSSAPSSLR